MARLCWVFLVDGQWLTRRELCQRTGINMGALQARMTACRHLLDRFDPELLAHPNLQVYHTARKFYESGRAEWSMEEIAKVFGMTTEHATQLAYEARRKLRNRYPKRREWVTE